MKIRFKSAIPFVCSVSQFLCDLPRNMKRLVVITVDLVSSVLATSVSIFLVTGSPNVWHEDLIGLGLVSCGLTVSVFGLVGLYSTILRRSGGDIYALILKGAVIYTSIYSLIWVSVAPEIFPWTTGLIQSSILCSFWIFSRVFGSIFLRRDSARNNVPASAKCSILVYATNLNMVEAFGALELEGNYSVKGFLVEDNALHGYKAYGKRAYDWRYFDRLVDLLDIKLLVIVDRCISQARFEFFVESCRACNVELRIVPALTSLVSKKLLDRAQQSFSLEQLKHLIGREAVGPDQSLLAAKITGRSVLVSGAGGSIGSELCRQMYDLKPKRLILVDSSEYHLYQILDELQILAGQTSSQQIEVVGNLVSVQDTTALIDLFQAEKPDAVFHAAAYKHVTLLQDNVLSAVRNNIFGTLNVGRAAQAAGCLDCVLVSTDKAVRPTSVMGSTKRVAEMIFQGLQSTGRARTIFSIVRFGNVIASSGSVIPRFIEQINRGGPVTVTHKDVDRYFMTIPEAAQLVIQASSLATGGDVFILDMGKPVKIIDMARRLIELCGLTERTSDNPDGNITIDLTGLKPGEKLNEELIIGDDCVPTSHGKIFRANERFMDADNLFELLEELSAEEQRGDVSAVLRLLRMLSLNESQIEDIAVSSEETKTINGMRESGIVI